MSSTLKFLDLFAGAGGLSGGQRAEHAHRHLAAELAAAGRPADAGGPVPAGDPPRIGADGPDRPVGR